MRRLGGTLGLGGWVLALSLLLTTLTSCLVEEPETCAASTAFKESQAICTANWGSCSTHESYDRGVSSGDVYLRS